MSKTYIDRCADQALEHIDTIEAMLSIGHTRTASAKAVGMKPTDLHNVVREGKSKRGKCHDILITVLKAEGRAQVRLETIVIRDAEVNVTSLRSISCGSSTTTGSTKKRSNSSCSKRSYGCSERRAVRACLPMTGAQSWMRPSRLKTASSLSIEAAAPR